MTEDRPTYAVVGAGVAGLAAARLLAGLEPVSEGAAGNGGARVVLVEASDRPGGKVRTGEVAGVPVELGPDQFLRRDPSAERLARHLGLGDRLRAPAGGTAGIYARGELRRLPAGLVLGVPTDLEALAASGIVSREGLAAIERGVGRAAAYSAGELGLGDEPGAEEQAAGELLRPQLGDEVVDYLVDPLLGGINAGRVDSLSLAVTAPGVARALLGERHVLSALGALPPPTANGGPVFYGLEGGLGDLVAAAAGELQAAGVELWLGTAARSLAGGPGGYLLETSGGTLACEGVVLAPPAGQTARLLQELAPAAARLLGDVVYADVSLVTFAFEEGALVLPEGWTGLLVPAREGRLMTAATFSSRKWPWMRRPGVELLRVSAGRFGDERASRLGDEELAEVLLAELRQVSGSSAPLLDRLVTRWRASFPQYRPGHRAGIARARQALPPGVALAGAALGGIGIPACISSGERAAAEVLAATRPA